MPTSLPRSAREAWGEAVAEDVTQWMRQAIREEGVPRDEYREVLSRLDVLEREVEMRFDETNARLDRIEARLDQMSAQTNDRFDRMSDRFDRMHEAMRVQTRWTVGAIVIIGAIITVLLAVAEFAA